MRWLNNDVEMDINSTIGAITLFSTFSLICCIITILIYVKMKTLRTLIYRFFFHVAINEIISRVSYILLLFDDYLFMFRISVFLIYITDTNILVLLAFTCFGMYQLILKQNNKLVIYYNKIIIGIYIFSAVIAIISYILSLQDPLDGREIDLYRNVICLYFIKDIDKGNLKALLFTNGAYFILLMFVLINIILIIIFIRDREEFSNTEEEDQSTSSDQKIKSSLKYKAFVFKLIRYPLLGLEYYVPLIVYSIIEHVYITNKDNYQENMGFYKIRWGIYNLFCFLNSIRGFIFFTNFIQNEKITKFLFENYLKFDIFKTIDKLDFDEDRVNSSFIEGENDNKKKKKYYSLNADESFDAILYPKKKSLFKKNKNNDKDINNKNSFRAGLINPNEKDDEEEEEEEEEKIKEKEENKII